ncbi:unnamed protein product [Gordionus sp. m RMFG-2023]
MIEFPHVTLHCVSLALNVIYIFKRFVLGSKCCAMKVKVKRLMLNNNNVAKIFREFTRTYSKEKSDMYTNRRKILTMITFMDVVIDIYYIYGLSIDATIFFLKFSCTIGNCVGKTMYYCLYLSKIVLLYDDLLRIREPCQYHNVNINIHIFIAILVSILFSSPKCFMVNLDIEYMACNTRLSCRIGLYINICFYCFYFGVSMILLITVAFSYWTRRRKICGESNCVPINTISWHRKLTNHNAEILRWKTLAISRKYVKVLHKKICYFLSLQIFDPYHIYIVSSTIFSIPFIIIKVRYISSNMASDWEDLLFFAGKYFVMFLIFSIYY